MRFTGDDDSARTKERIPRRRPPHCAEVELEGNTLTLTTRGNSYANEAISAVVASAAMAIFFAFQHRGFAPACFVGTISLLCTIWSIFELRSLLRVRCTRSPEGRIDIHVVDRRFRTRTYDFTVRSGTMPVRIHLATLLRPNRWGWSGFVTMLWIDDETGVTLGISRKRDQQRELLDAVKVFFGQRAPLGARLLGGY